MPSSALAQPTGLRFAIPVQPLSTALIAFGKQANLQVLTTGQTVAAQHSTEVTGTFTAEAALTKLLDGTHTTYEFVDARTVIIKPRTVASTMPKSATGAAAPTSTLLLSPIQAIGLVGNDVGFMADVSSGPTRTLSDPIDVPQSVGIVTQDLIQSQQLQTVPEAVQNVAGALYFDSSLLPIFSIRGFETGNGMTDGLANSISGVGDFPPLIAVERVEVLKGPQAILGDTSAGNDFGGLVNIVLKKPQSEPVHQVTVSLGEHGEKQVGVDLAGALNSSKTLSYRLIADGDVADRTVQGMRGERNRYVAPSMAWTTQKTTFIAGMSWMMNHMPIPDHVVLLGGTLSSASPSGILLDNPNDHTAVETRRFYYMFEHRFNDIWTFQSRAQYVRESLDSQDWEITAIQPTGEVNAVAENYSYKDAYYTLQNDVIATFGHGWMQHAVMLGFDYSRVQVGASTDALSNAGGGMSYNIFTGGPLPTPASMLVPSDNAVNYQPGSPWTTQSGLFIQDQISLGTQWDVLLAWRRATYDLQTNYPDGAPWNQEKVHWVPNYGLVYKLKPTISIYANTSNGFQPDTFLGKNGRPLPVSLSREVEIGSKFDLFDNRARLTVAAYRIMLNHSYDIVSFEPFYVVPGPGQTNNGVELEFNGQVTPGLEISSSFTNALVHNHDGSLATSAPRQRFNLWASYAFQNTLLHGWGVAGGVLARSRSLGETYEGTTYIPIPGQASVATNVFYRTHRWIVTLGVKNLFNRNLYDTYLQDVFVPLRNRRTYLLSSTIDL